jgi:hypothetical protein
LQGASLLPIKAKQLLLGPIDVGDDGLSALGRFFARDSKRAIMTDRQPIRIGIFFGLMEFIIREGHEREIAQELAGA